MRGGRAIWASRRNPFCRNMLLRSIAARREVGRLAGTLLKAYRLLFEAYGPQHWWPGETPFEVIVGALLTQNTSWRNVERAIANLRQEDLLDPRRLYDLPTAELEELLRPAGYFRLKAQRLKRLLALIVEQYGGSLETMFAQPVDRLREQLLAINGIGPETANSILLYAGGKAVFVVDAYTKRVAFRHGWADADADYHALQTLFVDSLPDDPALYNECHALLVRVGKECCRKQRPMCAACPLQELLPPGGPREPECC